MRFTRLCARGFRNLQREPLAFPAPGLVLLGPNGQGKTNLLEALYYPVLFRSLRGAGDAELVQFDAPGFELAVEFEAGGRGHQAVVEYTTKARRKRIELDGEEGPRLTHAAGVCLAVTFLPADVALAAGPALIRRRYLDRTLALADRRYLIALSRYRSAVAQRNAALRQGQGAVARAFDGVVATRGAQITAARLAWARSASEEFRAELEGIGEAATGGLEYSGPAELADPAAWPEALERSWARDQARGRTGLGPHRDDLRLTLGGKPMREFGSTGQQRSAAVALRLLELATLRRERGEDPALLLDDIFAELDPDRQARLGRRLLDGRSQVFLTAPRRDELPAGLDLPIWRVDHGAVRPEP